MRDSAPEDTIGYVAVHLPTRRAWQGFFVTPSFRERGEALLAKAGGVTRDPHGAVGVAEALPGARAGDQPAVGSLSALLARLLAMSTEPGPTMPASALQEAIAAAAYALHLAASARWLLVTGTPDRGNSSAYHTTVQRIDADNLDAAREAILEEVTRAGELGELANDLAQGLRRADRGQP